MEMTEGLGETLFGNSRRRLDDDDGVGVDSFTDLEEDKKFGFRRMQLQITHIPNIKKKTEKHGSLKQQESEGGGILTDACSIHQKKSDEHVEFPRSIGVILGSHAGFGGGWSEGTGKRRFTAKND